MPVMVCARPDGGGADYERKPCVVMYVNRTWCHEKERSLPCCAFNGFDQVQTGVSGATLTNDKVGKMAIAVVVHNFPLLKG